MSALRRKNRVKPASLLAAMLTALLAVVGLAGIASATGKLDPAKAAVCKYVGKPGVDERLQTGNNPIVVDRKADMVIGTFFVDAQGRSVVIAFLNPGDPEPDVSQCPAPDSPPPPPQVVAPKASISTECKAGTTVVNATVDNTGSNVNVDYRFEVTVDGVTKVYTIPVEAGMVHIPQLFFTPKDGRKVSIAISVNGAVLASKSIETASCASPITPPPVKPPVHKPPVHKPPVVKPPVVKPPVVHPPHHKPPVAKPPVVVHKPVHKVPHHMPVVVRRAPHHMPVVTRHTAANSPAPVTRQRTSGGNTGIDTAVVSQASAPSLEGPLGSAALVFVSLMALGFGLRRRTLAVRD